MANLKGEGWRGNLSIRIGGLFLTIVIGLSAPALTDTQNSAPLATDDSYYADENTSLYIDSPGVLANDYDVDEDSLTATLDSEPTSGILTLNTNGSFTYLPNTNFIGTDNFTYTANDGAAASNIATVSIIVEPIQTPGLIINELEINPPGLDTGKEWIELYNPTDSPVDLNGWQVSYTYRKKGEEVIATVPTTLPPGGYYVYTYKKLHLRNAPLESIQLLAPDGTLVDETPALNDEFNNDKTWQRFPTGLEGEWATLWLFTNSTKGEPNNIGNWPIGETGLITP